MEIGKYKQAMKYLLDDNAPLKTFVINPNARLVDNDSVGYATGGRVGFESGGTPKYTQKEINSPITGKASKLKGDQLMKWIKEQDKLQNYNDINFYKAIEKYKNEELGGNLFRFWEKSGLNRSKIEKGVAARRNFKFTTLSNQIKSELKKEIDTPFKTISEMTDAINEGSFNIKDRMNSLIKNGAIEKGKFYGTNDLAKILGVEPNKQTIDSIVRGYTSQKRGAYQSGVEGGKDVPYEQSVRKNVVKYNPQDIAENIQLHGENKTYGLGTQDKTRTEFESRIDPEFSKYKQNFKTRRSQLLHEEHPDFVQISLRGPARNGLNYDIGHPVPIALIEKHDFLQTPENLKKFHSISDFTIQDPRINKDILVKDTAYEEGQAIKKTNVESRKSGGGFQSKEDGQLIELKNFLNNRQGKKATKEDIDFINEWNKESKKIYDDKFESIKTFVNDRKGAEPYLKGQENTTFGFKYDLEPGQIIKPENLNLDRTHFKNNKSFGDIASIAPNAQTFKDLTPKQKELFHNKVVDQYTDYISDVAKASNIKGEDPIFNAQDIQDVKDTLKFGTNEKKGLINYKNIYSDPTGIGNVLETSFGKALMEKAPSFVNAVGKVAKSTGAEFNALLGIALNSDELKEKGFSDLETIGRAAYKGATEDFLNFADLVTRKLGTATYGKIVEGKPFFETWLEQPEYFTFATEGAEKAAEKKSTKERVDKIAEYRARKKFAQDYSESGYNPPSEEEFQKAVELEKEGIFKEGLFSKKLYYEEKPKVNPLDKNIPTIFGNVPREEEFNFAKGGRVGFADGSGPKFTRRGVLGLLTALAATPFVKSLIRGEKFLEESKLAKSAKRIPKVKGMPEWFPSLVAKIENEGKFPTKNYGTEDNVKIKELVIPSKTGKDADEVFIMTKYPNGKIEIHASVKGGAYDEPFELHYTPPETSIDETTGKVIKAPGDFSVVEQRPRPVGGPEDADFEFDWEMVSKDQALSDIEKIEKITTGKIADPKIAEKRAAQRKQYYDTPYDDITNRYGDAEIEYDRMKDAGLFDD